MGGFIAKNSEHWQGSDNQVGHFWLNHLSVTFNFDHLSAAIFHLTTDLKLAQENVPFFGTMIGKIRPNLMSTWQNPDLAGAVFALGLLAVLAVFLVRWRVKPE